MGLFSKLRAGAPANVKTDTEVARAVLSMPFMVAAADGKIDEIEIDQIMNMCSFSPIFHAIGLPKTTEMAKDIMVQLRSEGVSPVFSRAKDVLSPKLRETALCFAVRTAFADGHVDDSEREMLMTMGSNMGVSPEKFLQIFEVMSMLQRPQGA